MQAVLRHFVDTTSGRLYLVTVEVIERGAALSCRVAFLDRFGDVSLREHSGFGQWAAGSELRGDGGGKRTTGAVKRFLLNAIAK